MSYYKSLSKEERKKIKEEFLTSGDVTIYKKANRIIVLSIIGFVFAILAFAFDYLYTDNVISYILDGLLLIFSILFYLKTDKLRKNELNKYALSKNNEEKDNKKNKKSDK